MHGTYVEDPWHSPCLLSKSDIEYGPYLLQNLQNFAIFAISHLFTNNLIQKEQLIAILVIIG